MVRFFLWLVCFNRFTTAHVKRPVGCNAESANQALIAVQTVLKPSQIAVAMAMLTFVQGLGSAVLISMANTISFDKTFYVAIALSVLCYFTSCGPLNQDVRVKQKGKGRGKAVVQGCKEKKDDTNV